MSKEHKGRFLPYEEAIRVVAAIQEEEDIDDPDRRIFNVYNHQDKEICWFDYEEVIRDAGITGTDDAAKEKLTNYIMRHIPEWVVDS
ncbi:hypothetical protein [Desulfobulbus alkaliphilus]|uniref:hypothetical protein n=1 Tax=Desulfobulbus alkaliphilus TaxID=869814 RepID=UPI0019658EBC|nr:hypothetical protein [Desulfobulbus alkaliphilus]MBM9536354.1 hypothetical protein [Desulfobulbus alkaliphilus]